MADMDDRREYDEPHDLDALEKAEDEIEAEAKMEELEERHDDLDDRGMRPVCSIEQGKDVPIPYGETCACGGFENVSVDHDKPTTLEIDEDVEPWRPTKP